MRHERCPRTPKGVLEFYVKGELTYERCPACGVDQLIPRHAPIGDELRPKHLRGESPRRPSRSTGQRRAALRIDRRPGGE